MKKTTKPLIILIAVVMVMVPFRAAVMARDASDRDEPSAEAMAFDILVVRPLGLLALGLGAILNLIAMPFSATRGDQKVVQKKLVDEPAEFIFNRPVGDFEGP